MTELFVGLGISGCLLFVGAILLRHARRPRGDDAVWPSRAVGKGVLGIGVAFAVLGLAATVGVVEPP